MFICLSKKSPRGKEAQSKLAVKLDAWFALSSAVSFRVGQTVDMKAHSLSLEKRKYMLVMVT